MDLKKLLYFVTIVDEGQITRAAQRLHMAQPPLSLQLKALEHELGVQLLDRNNSRVEPTQAGWTFYYRAKEILNSVDGLVTEIKELGMGVRGKLSIGTVMSCVSYLPKPIQIFQTAFPQVTFRLWEGDSPQVEELLRNRLIDLGITRLPIESDDIEMIRLSAEPLVAVQPPDWGVLTNETISIHELKGHPLMALHGQGSRGLFGMFTEMCQNFGFNPEIICESPDVATLLTLVDSGVGIAIVPKLAVQLRPKGTLSYAEIVPQMTSDTAIIWPKGRKISKAAEHFKRILIDAIQ
ncbi:LysR family transcriptional regulator [Alicyclobacillus dauci]|uniref:LysR family transcriptional regulator n=1 Tax=Alicyclobacillus dauci TaxID=1475485 RepID=A0ABY6Z4H4_9BACL|nr:LysR family transcriptional regulator [Alicyclobacillus dauci]WAH37567.1 LysR family transcriptional regulator [Alicyclobacillus dauci]